jgi:hypothetical protein
MFETRFQNAAPDKTLCGYQYASVDNRNSLKRRCAAPSVKETSKRDVVYFVRVVGEKFVHRRVVDGV